MVGAHIRIAYHVQLQPMRPLWQREVQLHGKRLSDSDLFDRVELLGGRLPDDEPPIGHFGVGVERGDNSLLVRGGGVIVIIVGVAGECDFENDGRARGVVSLDKIVRHVQGWVRVDECCNIPPEDRLLTMLFSIRWKSTYICRASIWRSEVR